MMCPKCHHLMVRKSDGNEIYYFECQTCGNTIGKPEVVTTESAKETSKQLVFLYAPTIAQEGDLHGRRRDKPVYRNHRDTSSR